YLKERCDSVEGHTVSACPVTRSDLDLTTGDPARRVDQPRADRRMKSYRGPVLNKRAMMAYPKLRSGGRCCARARRSTRCGFSLRAECARSATGLLRSCC